MAEQIETETQSPRRAPDPGFLERLQVLVDRAGSKRQLALKAGLSENMIGRWMGGQKAAINDLQAVAEAMNVSFEWLGTGRGQETGPKQAEVDGILAELSDERRTPWGMVAFAVRQAGQIQFPDAGREREFVAALKNLRDAVLPLLADQDYKAVPREVERFRRRVDQLRTPTVVKQPAQAEVAKEIYGAARRLGWTGQEAELAAALLKDGESWTEVNEKALLTNVRNISRREIRDSGRRVWEDAEKYHAHFPKIPE